MPQHGEIDNKTNLVYCGYWMTFEDWEDIHKYSPGVEWFKLRCKRGI